MNNLYMITAMFMIIIICFLMWKIFQFPYSNSVKYACEALIGAVGIYILTDALFVYCFMNQQVSLNFFKVVSLIFYITFVTLPVLWYLFSKNFIEEITSRIVRGILCIPYIVLLLMILVGSFGQGLLWVINEEVRYDRGPLFGVFSSLNLFYYVVPVLRIFVILLMKRKEKNPYIFQTLIFSFIPLVGVLANLYMIPVQEVYPLQPFCFLIGALFAYFFLMEEQYNEENQEKTRLLEFALEREKENKYQRLREESKINQYRKAIVSGASAVYEINLSRDMLESVVIYEEGNGKEINSFLGNKLPCSFSEFIEKTAENMSQKEREQFLENNNVDHLLECFWEGKLEIQVEYHGKSINGQYSHMRKNYILTQDFVTRDIMALIVTKDVSREFERDRMWEMQIQSQMEVIEALGSEFSSIYKVDFEEEKIEKLSSNGQFRSITNVTDATEDYNEVFELYAKVAVHPGDKKAFLEAAKLSQVMKGLQEHHVYDVNYRRIVNGVMDYAQFRFMKTGKENSSKIICAVRSVDELVKKEKGQQDILRRALKKATVAERAKSTFLFNMSHDIRTPMNAIVGFNALAQKNIDNKEKALDALRKSEVSCQHLLNLINDVLDMARIESGKIELREETVDLLDHIAATEEMFRNEMEKKGLTFIVDNQTRTRYVVLDSMRVKQVVTNLLGNAMKFTKAGGTVVYQILEKDDPRDGKLHYEIHVKDTGIGMSKEFQKHLFTAFEREHTSTVSGIPGTGLGLAISRSIASLIGGSLTCSSKPGIGSDFTFSFCAQKSEKEMPDALENNVVSDDKAVFKGKRILLVEDNELNQEIAMEILKEYGFLTEIAENGAVAMTKITDAPAGYYDLVLMDIQMPVMDGYEATRQIRALEEPKLSGIPILAMTANAFDEDRQKALETGMDGFVSKPIDVEQLLHSLHAVLS